MATFLQKIRNTFASQIPQVTEESPTTLPPESDARTLNVTLFNRMIELVDSLTMTRLKQIFHGAMSGHLNHLIDVYIKIENSDARLEGMIRNRRQAPARAKHTIVPMDKDNQQAVEAAQLVTDNIKHLEWNKLLRDFMDGRMYGVAIFENAWKIRADGTAIIDSVYQVDHTRIEQYNLNQKSDRYGQLCIRTGKFGIDKKFVDEFEPYKLMVATNSNKEGMYDYAGVMRPVARWYVLKTFGVQSWAQYIEKYGFPIPIVKVPEEEYKKNKSTIKKLLNSVGANRWGIFFDSMEYELHQSNASGSSDVFDKFIDTCNAEMAIAILGQNLTTDVSGGSFAASKTHLQVLDDIIEDDVEWVTEIVQNQFVNPIVRINYPTLPLELYPQYKAELHRDVDYNELATGLRQMSRLVEIPKSFVYEKSQIPMPENDEEIVNGSEPDELMSRIQSGVDNGDI